MCYEVEVSSGWEEDINGALQSYIDLSFCFQLKDLKKKSHFKDKEKYGESHHLYSNMLWLMGLFS